MTQITIEVDDDTFEALQDIIKQDEFDSIEQVVISILEESLFEHGESDGE